MTTASSAVTGSASRWGPLWGARPADWALSEDRQVPTYEAALRRVGLEPGRRVLDIGCGVGAFLRLVAERGGEPHGIDASEALIAFARTRLPDADLRVGEMEDLPWDDDTLRPRHRLQLLLLRQRHGRRPARSRPRRQARRTGRDPGLGRARALRPRSDEADRAAVPAAAASRTRHPTPTSPSPGALEALATQAGLTPESEFDTTWALEYPDAETLGRAMVAVAGLAILAGPEREHELKTAIVDGLAPYRRADGSYRLSNEYHYLIARA